MNVVVVGKARGAHAIEFCRCQMLFGGALAGQDGHGSQSIPTHPCE